MTFMRDVDDEVKEKTFSERVRELVSADLRKEEVMSVRRHDRGKSRKRAHVGELAARKDRARASRKTAAASRRRGRR